MFAEFSLLARLTLLRTEETSKGTLSGWRKNTRELEGQKLDSNPGGLTPNPLMTFCGDDVQNARLAEERTK